jgi:hypothetical protein
MLVLSDRNCAESRGQLRKKSTFFLCSSFDKHPTHPPIRPLGQSQFVSGSLQRRNRHAQLLRRHLHRLLKVRQQPLDRQLDSHASPSLGRRARFSDIVVVVVVVAVVVVVVIVDVVATDVLWLCALVARALLVIFVVHFGSFTWGFRRAPR